MKQNKSRKLNLGKKTIARLSETDVKGVNGGSFTSIIQITAGCGSDFTRPGTTVISIGTSIRP